MESRRFAQMYTGLFVLWACCALVMRMHHRFNLDDIYGVYGYALGRFTAAHAQEARGYGTEFQKLPPGPVLLVGEERVLGIGRRWRGTRKYNIPLVKEWARDASDSRRFAIRAKQAGVKAVLLYVPGFNNVQDRGPAFKLTERELDVLNSWWKRLGVVYRSQSWIGYAVL